MVNKKKIAILNMYYDNNYGGNLQRYALMTVLQRMDYDVTYLYIRQNWSLFSGREIVKKTIKQALKHHILGRAKEPIEWWKIEKEEYIQQSRVTEPFLEKYIPHSHVLYGTWWLKRYIKRNHFDAYIVGSDQVWRKQYVQRFGLGTWFFDFLPLNYSGKRIAYGASFGVRETEYDKEEQERLRPLFNKFDAVSVREESGLDLLKQYGWTNPRAEVVLDPTLLLTAEDYQHVIDAVETKPLEGKLLCYILDLNDEKEKIIQQTSKQLGLQPTMVSSGREATISVEQWLRDFSEAEYVITDSYHGLIFSLIFHKQFTLMVNQSRGASRFDSVEHLLNFHINELIDWTKLDKQMEIVRDKSIRFLKEALAK